jgi:two-component system, NarL family, sensor histidine kinase UhpB
MSDENNSLRLLVVEDNPGDYALLSEYLKMARISQGHTLHAPSITAASELVKKNEFDVALLDLSLPDSSGIDSVITLDRLLPEVPIVVFSGMSDVSTAMEAISLGAQDYLVKGEFDEKILDKTIHYSIERKKMLEKLRQSNERYELVNKATLDTIWEWRFDLNSGIWGDGISHMFGYADTDLHYGDDWMRKYIHPEDRERVNSRLKLHIEQKMQHWQDEYRFRCADGSFKFVHDRGFIVFDDTGSPFRMIGAITDITEKRKLEKELADQELAQQKLITEVTIQAQEKERNELGRELHDNINQVLATIKMYLSMSLEKAGMRQDLTLQSLENVNYAIEEIRKLSKSLVSPSLGDIGLAEALQELAEEINLANEFHVELVNQINNQERIDSNMELMLYRVAQEQLNNIRKYAKAKQAVITVRTEKDHLYFSVKDDGVGFDPAQKANGIGLKNIRSRVDFYSGTLNIVSSPGKGCLMEITIPFS